MVVYDVNMIEEALALGLADKMVGYWTGGSDVRPEFGADLAKVTPVSTESWPPPALEPTLGANPDVVFSGWGYAFSEESGLTPAKLKAAGVNSYAIRESCVRAGAPEEMSIDDTYEDIMTIGRIFGVADKAQAIVDGMKAEVAAVQQKLGAVDAPVRALHFETLDDKPFTAGRYGMATGLMAAAGGQNVMLDLAKDYANVSWEEIIDRNPEVIVVLDSSWTPASKYIELIKSKPELASISAVKNDRFVALSYRQALPGLRNAEAIRILAQTFHPEKFEQ